MSASPTPPSAEDEASFRHAASLFEQGRHAQAEAQARALLARLPTNPDVRHLLALAVLNQGRAAEALELVDGLLREMPRDPFALNTRAAACRALGRTDDAISAWRAALAVEPGYADAAVNLATALAAAGRAAEALQLAAEGAARMPQFMPFHAVAGEAAAALGRHEDARSHLAQALHLAPGHPGVLATLGEVQHRLGRHAEALACFDAVVAALPGDTGAHTNRGRALLALRRPGEAEAAFRRAVERDPKIAAAWHNLAVALNEQGRFGECEEAERRALQLDPAYAEASFTLASALSGLGRAAEAEAVLRELIVREPGHVRARVGLCGALTLRKRHAEALQVALEAARLAPGDALAQGTAANLLAEGGRFEEAIGRYDEAVRLAPGEARWQVLRAVTLPVVPASEEEIARVRREVEERVRRLAASELCLDDPGRHIGATGFYLAYHGLGDLELQRDIARMHLALHPELAWEAPHARRPRPRAGRRLRVGFASAFLHDHTIGKLYRGFIEKLDRGRFEVIAVHAMTRRDPVRAAIDAAADRAIELPARLEAARRAVAGAELDVLFYPDVGMHSFSYFLAFSRLAPVQVTSWGHPDTTGLPSIDWFVSSEILEPPGAEAHYGERLARLCRLPACFARPRPAPALGVRARLGLPAGARVYACPQSLFKLHPAFDATLGRLLAADPAGHLVLISSAHAGWNDALLRRLGRTIPQALGRIRFLPFLPEAEFLDLLASADAIVDPVHFGGGNSSYEAFGLGLPVVTMPGPFMRGRVTLGCYRQMGFEDLVARDAGEYVALAVRLANDAAFREAMRARVRAGSGAIFDDDGALREMESFLESAFDEAAAREGA